ncbi:aldo/keto reductase [Granulicella sp. L60]|uniref:aldo/keto reductase n=1 Tax=Granulicella sp. L60 TaxID=1641866 RepID=UPI00131C294B|nr:aldo/keto reductase [Granulicella sp. L60]
MIEPSTQSAPVRSLPRWSLRNPLFTPAGRRLSLGLGLIGIGKPWGHSDDTVPSEKQVRELLETAFTLGIRYLDTAPSYGVSEQRLSEFLSTLTPAKRASLTLATKFGEHWNPDRQEPFVEHSYDILARSLDGSVKRLGHIDLLQLHKTTPEVLRSRDVERAFLYARSLGISNLGASVSDLDSAELALSLHGVSVLQFPLNPASQQFVETARRATESGILVVTNRPFGMGGLLYAEPPLTHQAAFEFLIRQPFDGVVLTGTKSIRHLHENWAAFNAV